jgi:hypothetical protein
VRAFQAAEWRAQKVIAWQDIGVPTEANIERPFIHIYKGVLDELSAPQIKGTSPGTEGWCDVWIDEWLTKAPAVGWQRQGRTRKRRLSQEWVGAVQWTGCLYDGGTGDPKT